MTICRIVIELLLEYQGVDIAFHNNGWFAIFGCANIHFSKKKKVILCLNLFDITRVDSIYFEQFSMYSDKSRLKGFRCKYAHIVIGHPKDLNSTTKIVHHATMPQQDGIKNINKIIVRKKVRVAKITIGKLVPKKIDKMSEIGHVVYCRL
jgi:hypothetical protein